MADRYWVGGTGNWNDTARWSTGSGGSSGASVPTSADNVFFDDNSAAGTFTVTINVANAACANFDASGIVSATKKMTLTGTASVGLLSVNGNWTNPSSTYFAWTSWTAAAVTFAATGTVITNSVTFSPIFTVNGSGITVTLGGALTPGGAFNLTNGTFDTSAANNYSLTFGSNGSITISANSNTRSLNLNASSLSLSGAGAVYSDSSTGGFTLNAGTSTVTFSGGSATFSGGGKTFYNVSFTSTATGTHTINGANSFNNLSFTAPTSTGIRVIAFGADQTVTGTLTVGTTSSVSAIQRIFIRSSAFRTQRTITMSGASSSIASVYDVDFRDTVIAQASGSTAAFPDDSSRTYRYGDCQNNSGITFSAGVSRYWNLSGSQNWSATGWATTNNGSPALANFPLAQDTATFTEVGAAGTVTIDASWNIGSIQMADGVSNRTTAFTLATGTTAPVIYGNITLFSSLTLSGTGTVTFAGYNQTSTVKSTGITFTQPISVTMTSGTFAIDGNLTVDTARTFTLNLGTLDLTNNGAGNYTLSTGLFNSNNSSTRSITFGTGNITTTGSGTVWDTGLVTNFSYTGTPTVNISNNSATATTVTTGTPTEAQALNFNYTIGTYTLTDTSSRYKNLSFSGFTGTVSNSTRIIYGDLTLASGATNNAGASTTTFSATSGTQTLATNGVTMDYPVTQNSPGATLRLAGNTTLGITRTFLLIAGTLDLTNNGAGNYTLSTGGFNSNYSNTRSITFGTGNITTTGSGTVWSTATITNFSYTGTPTVNISNNSSTATTIAASTTTSEAQALNFNINIGTYSLSYNAASMVAKNLIYTGFSGTVPNTTQTIYGDLTISSSATNTAGTNVTTFAATSGTQTLTTNGVTMDYPVTQNSPGATLRLVANTTLGTTRAFTLTAGTLDLTNNGAGNYTLSTGAFASNNSNIRSIAFGTGNITTTGSGTVWSTATTTNFSYTGTPTVNISNNSGTATTVATGTLTEAQALNFNYTIGTYTLTDTSSVYKSLSFSGFTGTVPNSARTIYGNLTLASGATNSAGTNATSFLATSGTQNVTTNTVTVDYPITQNNPGATVKLIDNCTMGSTRVYTLTAGTLDLNTNTLTASTLTNTGTSTRAVTFNGGTITLSGSGATVWNASGSGFTTSAGSGNGTISLTSASAKTFVGGGYTYAAALNQGGAGALTVSGSNSFSGLKNSSQPATITITASTTQTFTGPVTLAGTSGNLITLNSSSAGTRYTFTYPVSTTASSLSFCSIIDCIGYQNAYWRAYQTNGCVNAGNNLGWVFNPIAYNSGGSQFGT